MKALAEHSNFELQTKVQNSNFFSAKSVYPKLNLNRTEFNNESVSDFPNTDSEFQDGPREHGDQSQTATPQQTGTSNCPSLVSLTVQPSTPTVSDSCRNRCRMGLGCCTTPRGQCGTNNTGAVMTGSIRVPDNCSGTLGLLQNVTSTDRRKTLSNGSQECMSASSAHMDGGVPWKGCQVSVTTSGTHNITSDDCPNVRLRENMTAASAVDSFKTYLIWKPAGTNRWQTIGVTTWGWHAAAARSQNTTGTCTNIWSLTSQNVTSGTGTASTERPTTSPHIRDLNWQACSTSGTRE